MFKIAICDDVEDVCSELKPMHLNLNYTNVGLYCELKIHILM